MAAKLSRFKGHPMLELSDGSGYKPFAFGYQKAKLIVANFEAIKAFVDAQSSRPSRSGPDRFDMAYEDRCAEAAGFSAYGPPDQQ